MNFLDHLRAQWFAALFGCILYITAIAILFWNEGRAVNNAMSLDEAMSNVYIANANHPIDPSLEGRLIHITGKLTTGEPLTEPDYGIQVLAVKLKRRVQMYQWIEEEVEYKYGESVATIEGNDRTYYYSMDWRDNIVDSSMFYIRSGHNNPTKFPIQTRVQLAEHVSIGYFELGSAVKSKVTRFIDLTSDSRPEDPSVKLHSGLYYHCNDVFNPEVGDLRIQFSFSGLEGTTYTVVGMLQNGKIVPYPTTVNINVLLVFEGDLTLASALKAAHYSYKLTTWGFRFIGFVLLFFAITCTTALLQVLFCQNRLLWSIMPDADHPVTGNLILSFSIALAVTALAWIFHRPWIGCSMIFAAISPFLLCARGVIMYQRVP